MFPILQLGPIAIQVPGLLLLAGIWIGTLLAEREAVRYQLDSGKISTMIFVALIAGIIGARLVYALNFLDLYRGEPLSLFALNLNTLAPLEGMAIGFLAAIVYAQRNGIPLLATLDTLTLGAAVFAIFFGLSHLSSGDAFGAPSDVHWAIHLWGVDRHPAQVYELLAAIIVTLVVLKMRKKSFAAGFIFALFIALSALSRLFLEGFRGDSLIIFNSIRAVQVVSLIMMILALLALHVLTRRSAKGTNDTLV
jgi:prolipoprotein diacylglyceryltransferase